MQQDQHSSDIDRGLVAMVRALSLPRVLPEIMLRLMEIDPQRDWDIEKLIDLMYEGSAHLVDERDGILRWRIVVSPYVAETWPDQCRRLPRAIRRAAPPELRRVLDVQVIPRPEVTIDELQRLIEAHAPYQRELFDGDDGDRA